MVMISGSCLARNAGSMGLAPASGKSTLTPSLSSGAVIMKMTSSTNMTSIYGTTLISPISLRRSTRAMLRLGRAGRAVALQDRRELFHEGVEPQLQAAHLIGESVVGHHRGNRGEQSDRRGDQRLGDARRHGGKGGLLYIPQIVEGRSEEHTSELQSREK